MTGSLIDAAKLELPPPRTPTWSSSGLVRAVRCSQRV